MQNGKAGVRGSPAVSLPNRGQWLVYSDQWPEVRITGHVCC